MEVLMPLERANTEYLVRLFRKAGPVEKGFWTRTDVEPFRPDGVAQDVQVSPVVNHGRWVIDCPGEDCPSAQLASPEHPLFFCVDCLNDDAENLWIRVMWPDDADDVEALMARRKRPKNRNWLAHETLADLWAENVRAAVSSLDDVPDELRAEVESKLPRAVQLTESIELPDGTVHTRRLPGVEDVLHELPSAAAVELMELPTEFPPELEGVVRRELPPGPPHVVAPGTQVHPESEMAEAS